MSFSQKQYVVHESADGPVFNDCSLGSIDWTCLAKRPSSATTLYLSACFLFLGSGFNEGGMSSMKEIINDGGATRFVECGEGVTHYVLGGESLQER